MVDAMSNSHSRGKSTESDLALSYLLSYPHTGSNPVLSTKIKKHKE